MKIKNVNGAIRLSNFWNFFGSIQIISCRDWWPWTKPGYITMTRRRSNNQWSGGIAAHPAPNNSEWKNPLENFSPRFFGIKMASSPLIIFQRAKLSTRSITHLCWCNWRTFWRKNAMGSSPTGHVLARQCPGLPGTCNPEETGLPGHPLSWSPNLFSGSGPVGLPPVPWTNKTIERSPFFVRRGGHCCRGDPVGRTTFSFFFECLANVRAKGLRNVLSFVGSMLNKSRVAFFLVGLRTYQHPLVCIVFSVLKSCRRRVLICTGSSFPFSKRYFVWCGTNRLVSNDKFWFYWCVLKFSRNCYNECTTQVYLGPTVCINTAFCVCKTQM